MAWTLNTLIDVSCTHSCSYRIIKQEKATFIDRWWKPAIYLFNNNLMLGSSCKYICANVLIEFSKLIHADGYDTGSLVQKSKNEPN